MDRNSASKTRTKTPKFIDVKAGAKILNTSPDALRSRIKRKQLPKGTVFRLGTRTIRIDRAALLRWALANPI